MLPAEETSPKAGAVSHDTEYLESYSDTPDTSKSLRHRLSRKTYYGSILFNIAAFLLPALYSTLSKLWIASIDSKQVVTTDVYTYISTVVEVLNEGLPRASWLIIGDKTSRTFQARLSLSYTLILFQTVLGLVMSIVFLSAASQFASVFVPASVYAKSLTYIRISSFSALASTLETSVSSATRALDRPDVPLIISSVKFAINIILDMLIISKFRVGNFTPSVNTQAIIRLACDLTAAFFGFFWFVYTNRPSKVDQGSQNDPVRPSLPNLWILARPGFFTFVESAIRNALYLWLVSGIVAMGSDYATAWGVFNTIRWGLIMVPVQALEASSLAFIGHAWGRFRMATGLESRRPRASRKDLTIITRPALKSVLIALAIEVPLCIFLAEYGARRFAYYLSQSDAVSVITEKMWKTIDWCYIFYAASTQLAAILLATQTRWYLYQSLVSNIFWVLPWAVVVSKAHITPDDAWKYHSIVFGGSLVFSFVDILIVVLIWAWCLRRGKMKTSPVRKE